MYIYGKCHVLWDYLLYAFFKKDGRQACQPVLHDVLSLSVTPQTLAGQEFLEVMKQVLITWCKVGTVWRMRDVVPSLNNLYHFLTSPSFIASLQ